MSDVEGQKIVPIPKRISVGAPNYITVKLKYCEDLKLEAQAISNIPTAHLFRTNSIYDPDFTGVGHQPEGRDIWCSIYDYYKVIGMEYRIQACRFGDLSEITSMMLHESSNAADIQGLSWSNSCENKTLITSQILNMNNTPYTFTGMIGCNEIDIDVDDQKVATVWTPVGNNPVESKFFGVSHVVQYGSNNVGLAVNVQLTYTVQFRQYNAALRQEQD